MFQAPQASLSFCFIVAVVSGLRKTALAICFAKSIGLQYYMTKRGLVASVRLHDVGSGLVGWFPTLRL